jgi:hypothetical protein
MVNTSIALKSHLDVDIVDPTPIWPYALFPSEALPQSPGKPEPGSSVVQAITGLQREVLLLRNELNFESWLARENVRQIGRLFEQRIMSRNAEVERQNLVSTLPAINAVGAYLSHLSSTISCGRTEYRSAVYSES